MHHHSGRTLKARILISVIICFLIVSIPCFFILFSHMNNLVFQESSAAGNARVMDIVDEINENLESVITAVAWIADEDSVRDALSYSSMSEPGAALAILDAQNDVSTFMTGSIASEYLNKIVVFKPGTDISFEFVRGRSGWLNDSDSIMSTDEFDNLSFPTGSVVRLFLSETVNLPEELAVVAYGRTRENDGYIYAELSSDIFDSLYSYADANNIFIVSDGQEYPEGIPESFFEENKWTAYNFPLSIPDSHVIQFIDRSPLRIASSYGLAVFIAIILASTILFVIISFILSRSLTKATRKLEKHIGYLTVTNDFGYVDKSIEEGDDEIAAIGHVVNKMSVSISELLKRNEKLFEEKKKMEMDMLQMQVNPHFLYNTLESIHYLAEVQKDDGIAHMARGLSTLLRNMAKGSGDIITLSEELSLLSDYDEIQQVRYMGMYEIAYCIPEDLMDMRIQKFTLQPLVENAIFHGIEPTGRFGMITISAVVDGTDLSITVHDDGIGMNSDEIAHIFDEKKHSKTDMTGVGVRNINERIKLMYGNGYGLSFRSEKGKYTEAVVKIKAERYVQDTDS